MPLATVHVDIAPLYKTNSQESPRLDEVLYGMSVQVMDQPAPGWCFVRTEYGTSGFTSISCLNTDVEVAAAWKNYKKKVVLSPYIDILATNNPKAPRLASLPRGSIIVPLGKPAGAWQRVGLPTGKKGYTSSSYLGEFIYDWADINEEDMRWNIVETALSYNGVAYREGGRTTLGIDSLGLVCMSYLLNGVKIPQQIEPSSTSPARRIRFESMRDGDILYFPGSMGIYIGENRFIHSTLFAGNEGVIVSSLSPRDADYREDLAENIVTVASLF